MSVTGFEIDPCMNLLFLFKSSEMTQPEIAYQRSVTTKTVEDITVRLFIRDETFDWVDDLPNSTFTAKNGVSIKCGGADKTSWDGTVLKLSERVRGKKIKLVPTTNSEKLDEALRELASAIPDYEWTCYPKSSYFIELQPKTAFLRTVQKRTVDEKRLKLFIRSDVFRYVNKMNNERFKASNGITIACGTGFNPGFENTNKDTVYLGATFDGKAVDLTTSGFANLPAFETNYERVTTALKELQVYFKKSPEAVLADETKDFTDWVTL